MKDKLIGEYLIADRRITPAQLEKALEIQATRLQGGQVPLIGNILLEFGTVNEQQITEALEKQKHDRAQML